jgi:hypothetical protein
VRAADGDFYVGYAERAPRDLGRFLGRIAAALLLAAPLLAAALASRQGPLGAGVYEFGVPRPLTGVVELLPYPVLRVERPGAPASVSRYPVVAFGKRGADAQLAPFAGRQVSLEAALVHRDGWTMLELVEGSVVDRGPVRADESSLEDGSAPAAEWIETRGEIVDSKCFLGAMRPGVDRTHRACAQLCLRGGIPPLWIGTRTDEQGRETFLKALLVGPGDEAIGAQLLPLVAEPVELRGELVWHGELAVLRVDPAIIRRL